VSIYDYEHNTHYRPHYRGDGLIPQGNEKVRSLITLPMSLVCIVKPVSGAS